MSDEYADGARVYLSGPDGPEPHVGGEVVRSWVDADTGIRHYYVRWDNGMAGACTGQILASSDSWPWKMRGELDNEPEPDEARERFGFGVCVTGMCIEPCGPNGGCIR